MKNLLPEQCRAARGMLDWTQERLAATAGVSRSTVRDFECGRHGLHPATEAMVVRTFEEAGIRLVSDRQGSSVRLQKCGAGQHRGGPQPAGREGLRSGAT